MEKDRKIHWPQPRLFVLELNRLYCSEWVGVWFSRQVLWATVDPIISRVVECGTLVPVDSGVDMSQSRWTPFIDIGWIG
jgi:hypothetical protein